MFRYTIFVKCTYTDSSGERITISGIFKSRRLRNFSPHNFKDRYYPNRGMKDIVMEDVNVLRRSLV